MADPNFTDKDASGNQYEKTKSSSPESNDDFLNSLDDLDDKELFSYLLTYDDEDTAQYPYLVRGASLFCDQGTHHRKLNLPMSHAVNTEGKPIMHDHDCAVGDDGNIATFGICNSAKIPKADKILLVSEDGKSNVKGYPCTPVIVGGKWLNGHPHTLIADNCPNAQNVDPNDRTYYPALTMDSFLVCKFCGTISPETSGQEDDTDSSDSGS